MTRAQRKILDLLENYIEYSKENCYIDFYIWCEDNIDTTEEESILQEIYQEVNYVANKLFR